MTGQQSKSVTMKDQPFADEDYPEPIQEKKSYAWLISAAVVLLFAALFMALILYARSG